MTDKRNDSDTDCLERVTDERDANESARRDVRSEAHRIGTEAVARALEQPVANLD